MRQKAILACSTCGARNYSTQTSKDSQSERFEVKKFCKTCNAHTLHKETK
ncbi:MAG: 50S ribosomal protein L33 [Bacillus sp. (in: firmicutes)]